ncbi:MAG TPA: hypothetical protein VM182_11540 [Terriglobia bacterium]|nr:hypothetical protein [Terriglobia bacterium]
MRLSVRISNSSTWVSTRERAALRGYGRTAERAFKIVDTVEGFQAIAPERALFKRETVEVTLASKRCVIAWVY